MTWVTSFKLHDDTERQGLLPPHFTDENVQAQQVGRPHEVEASPPRQIGLSPTHLVALLVPPTSGRGGGKGEGSGEHLFEGTGPGIQARVPSMAQ